MDYISLYRAFRPGSLKELVGQAHIVRTLTNALNSNRVGHAYLFCGPRGTGKTSTARILAKSLNCEKGISTEPCGVCNSCERISKGYSLDVIEIDAASNRGINEIRDLKEKVKFSPSESRYKVYIIDEIHMLTNEAFNALLKTLEEPPSHVVFVFATTDPLDIPPTIISRCQRFDFKPISIDLLQNHLSNVCRSSGVEITDAAIELICRRASGGVRDALSTLEQCISYADGKVTVDITREILGLSDEALVDEFIRAVSKKDKDSILKVIDLVCKDGRSIGQFVNDVLSKLRDRFVYSSDKGYDDLETRDSATILMNIMAHPLWRHDERLALEVGLIKYLVEPKNSQIACNEKVNEKVIPQTPAGSDKVVASSMPSVMPEKQVPLDDVLKAWDIILDNVRKAKVSLKAFLIEGKPTSFDGNILTISYARAFSFHKENISLPKNKAIVEGVISDIIGTKINIHAVLASDDQDNNLSVKTTKDNLSRSSDPVSQNNKPVGEELDPIVKEAIRIFGGKLVKIDDGGNS